MKSVLISTRPEWCEEIASGDKTAEVRKTRPKIEPPFKCYIYCTKVKFNPHEHLRNNLHYDDSTIKVCEGQGKVIGEFVCDRIDYWNHHIHDNDTITLERASELSRVSEDDLVKYADLGHFYAWHISDLVIYEKPRPLSDFKPPCDGFDKRCQVSCAKITTDGKSRCTRRQFTRPPQSWCYVEGGE